MQQAIEILEQIRATNAVPKLFPNQPLFMNLGELIAHSPFSPLIAASLHLWNDDLDNCHRIVQQRELPNENYLHAILHRREKDFSNSLYWYRRVGKHPVLKKLESGAYDWTPIEFVAACEEFSKARTYSEPREKKLREWQATEMLLLFNHLLEA